ncbi:hypothetical protein [Winogradskyella sp.]|uniref:hypothetical protein n=1 Tax=Winogradskyella sp. TaxID=1883156 RepID=UPI00260F4C23|nr:hypothetical protein [Winogradskyella sp.]
MKSHTVLRSIFVFGLLFCHLNTIAQYKVYTQDISNFWEAYDSIQTTDNKDKQIDILQRLYVGRGTVGLRDFMELRGGTPEIWQKFINEDKERFEKIRPYTLTVLEQKKMIDKGLENLKILYPDFKDADVFFAIGIGNSGGTIKGNHVLIGCEVMANEQPDWAVQIVLHEFIHTQQVEATSGHLLAHTIYEGMADFISELVNDKEIAAMHPNGHIAFAQNNKDDLWKSFKKYIYANDDYNYHGWLYGNGGQTINGINMDDLGYGMGYLICKSFYENATNKKAAIKEMLTTYFTDENARSFLLKSGFVPEKDLKYVKNFEFKPLDIKNGKKIKKITYGYKVKRDNIEFIIKSKDIPFKVKSLSVAGIFNNWNPKSKDYQMHLEKGKYVLRLPKANFENGQKHYFKFVANENSWLQPPIEAKNSEKDASGNLNLYLEL